MKEKIKNYFNSKVDVVISDMAVNTTGNKNLDSINTSELCIEAMNFSKDILKKMESLYQKSLWDLLLMKLLIKNIQRK